MAGTVAPDPDWTHSKDIGVHAEVRRQACVQWSRLQAL
jgi:hypothetical protein